MFLGFTLPLHAAEPAGPLDTAKELQVIERISAADWIDVKRSVKPAALGDGKTDDTAALQAALDKMHGLGGVPKVVYLPPGTYRITRTLVMPSSIGCQVIGHGAATRIIWDGRTDDPEQSRMAWSKGATEALWSGIVWDGNGKARIGFHHEAHDRFECKVIHEYEAFVNCTEAGVRMGLQKPFATSETEYRACIFANCGTGLALLDFNYYNIVVDACLFRNNGTGIFTQRYGQVYARNSRFEASRERDLLLGASHKHAVRRCVSIGSRAFIEGECVTVQDCQVSGWTGKDGAIVVRSAATPVTIFDCVFKNPPSDTPPIRCSDPNLRLLLSNNHCDKIAKVVEGGKAIEVPDGKLGGIVSQQGLSLSFALPAPSKLIDAVRNFGADKGDDQTAAVQATIDAARAQGKGAVAYFPPRRYRIKRTIEVTGADYIIAGTGYHTEFVWAGPQGGTVFHVEDPQNVTLSHFQILTHSVPRNMLCILQSSAGKPSSITYDGIMAGSHGDLYRADSGTQVRGIEFRGLGANCQVHVKRVNGSGAFIDSTAANILLRYWDGGPIVVANPGKTPRTGFLGGLNANVGGELVVQDSSDLVFTEFYKEQGKSGFIQLYGKPDDSPGRVTLGAARLHLWKESPYFAQIDGYRGQLTYAHAHVTFDKSPEAYRIEQKSPSPFTLALLTHDNFGFDLHLDSSAKLVRAANRGVDDLMPPDGLAAIGIALDHWRLLGQKDVEFTIPPPREK
jgi:hypothetical protein